MKVFEVVVALLLGGAILAALTRRFGAPYPALVALAGAALALMPGLPTVLKQLRPPHRRLVILEGESLFNDASLTSLVPGCPRPLGLGADLGLERGGCSFGRDGEIP